MVTYGEVCFIFSDNSEYEASRSGSDWGLLSHHRKPRDTVHSYGRGGYWVGTGLGHEGTVNTFDGSKS